MKENKIKNSIIVILIILIIIFTILLVTENTKPKNITIESNLSKNEIYSEVTTEVTQGEEKYISHDENGNRINTSTKMQEVKKVEGDATLKVEGITITANNNITQISGKVTNTGEKTDGDCIINLSLKDDTGVEILLVGVYINDIETGGETEFNTVVSTDLANAYSYDATKQEV